MPTGNGATDLNGAASQLSALINSEPESLPTESEKPVEEQETLEVTEQPETLESDTEEAKELHKVKVDGEELEVDYDELLKGYSREASYRQKTMKHANEIKAQREEIEAKTSELDNSLTELKTMLDNDYSMEDMQALKEDDPDLYIKKLDERQRKQEKFQQLQSKRQAALNAKQENLVKKEREALLNAFPEWSDTEVQNKEVTEIFKTLGSYGYTEGELQGLTDHRLFVIADMARKYSAIENAKQSVAEKKATTKSKSMKPGTPKTTHEKSSQRKTDAMKRLKQTGSRHAAYEILSS